MFGSEILGIVFGMIFILLLFSLLAAIVTELIASILRMRAATLRDAVYRMLEDSPATESGLAKSFYNHPLINRLGQREKQLPSYIAPSIFARVLKDILKSADNPDDSVAALRQGIQQLQAGETRTWLLSVINGSGERVEDFTRAVEDWFSQTMDRTSGWFKRKVQLWTLGVGMAIAIAFNVDSINVFRTMNTNAETKDQLAALAAAYLTRTAVPGETRNDASRPADSLSLLLSGDADSSLLTGDDARPDRQRREKPRGGATGVDEQLESLVRDYQRMADAEIKSENRLLGLGWRSIDDELKRFSCDRKPGRKPSMNPKERKRAERAAAGAPSERDGSTREGRRGGKRGAATPTSEPAKDQPANTWNEWLQCSKVTFWFLKGAGWLLTAIGIVLGSSLWFDLLQRVTNLRGTGPKPRV
jgi:hypothetical protein